MLRTPFPLSILVAAFLSAGVVTAQAAGGLFYDPSNVDSPTGKTIGYKLFRTIGCPGRELLGVPCPVPKPVDSGGAVGNTAAAAVIPSPPAAVVVMEPVPVVVPVQAQTEQYCSILDIRFEIDRDEMQRKDKEKLAVLGTFMNKYPDTTAVIEGHTDNVGTAEDNMRLSQRRAESVVTYLVDNLHIAPSRLTAVGYGETRPIADNRSQEGKRQNRRIDAVIACATDIAGLTVAPARLTMAMVIEFDPNQAEIKPQFGDGLRKVADFMKANPSVTATVEGNAANLLPTPELGLLSTPELGMKISQLRAQAVVDYLVGNLGVERSRLSVEAFGDTRRFAYNTSKEGQQENRRVNIIFNYPK
ncbi:MAG: OmpA family protein [Thiobacillaceae bacterium]